MHSMYMQGYTAATLLRQADLRLLFSVDRYVVDFCGCFDSDRAK